MAKLKFKAHRVQTQMTPPACLLFCPSHSALTEGVCKRTNQKTSQSAVTHQPI